VQTFAQWKRSSGINVLGNCANSPQGVQKLNDGIERLMQLGDWSGLIVPIQVCTWGGCAVLPRYVGQVRKINVCNRPMAVKSFWETFQPRDCNYNFALGWGGGAGAWWGNSWLGRYCGAQCTALNYGMTQFLQNIQGEGRLVRAYPRCNADIGSTVTIFGIDDNGNPLHTRDADDNYSDGIVLTLAKPFVSTSVFVRRIDRIIKDETQCIVDVYGYDATNDVLETIGHYEPSELVPEYTRVQIQTGCNNSCNGVKSVMALVKLRFVPVVADTDFVILNNTSALKAIIQSNAYSEEGNLDAADQFEQKAIRILNRQLSDDFPLSEIPTQIATFSNTGIGSQRVW